MAGKKIAAAEAIRQINSSDELFKTLFRHGSLEAEIYKPDQVDRQQPHDRDEIYVIVSGSGQFFCAGETVDFHPGDFLFVPAGDDHRFLDFTNDFITWVFFYGPQGGEK